MLFYITMGVMIALTIICFILLCKTTTCKWEVDKDKADEE